MVDETDEVVVLSDEKAIDIGTRYSWHEFLWKGIKMYGCDSCAFTTQYESEIRLHISQHRIGHLRKTGLIDEDGRAIITGE